MPKPRPPNLTPLENMVYDAYLHNDFLDDPGDPVWTNSLSDMVVGKGMKSDQFPGVVSSLVKKGVFAVNNVNKKRNDDMIWLL